MENFSEYIKKILVEDCEIPEENIANLSKHGALEVILCYEGIIGYTSWIINLIEEIYGVSLEK